MKKIIFIIFLMVFTTVFSQEELSLTECYSLAESNHPIAKQNELIPQQSELNTDIINTKKYPKIDFDAQATYQSDVIHFPTENPGLLFELPNKDQYRATLTVNQLIYGGGSINAAVEDENAKSKTQQQNVQVELYQLKPKINQLYFSILLLQEKKDLLLTKQKQLQEKLKEVKAGIKYGALLPASDSVLEAELLKLEQQLTEIESSKTNLIQTLEKYLGVPVNNSTTFIYPEISETLSNSLNRPEIDLFNLQKDQIDYTSTIISKDRLPKVYGFAQGGYGNPGINMLDNSFQAFYIVGLKLNWNVFDWNQTKKKTQALELNKQFIDTEKEKFELNTSIQLEQQTIEITKYQEFIISDQSIIELHKKILNTADSQLKNGVITSSVYIEKLTDLYEVENNLKTHQIQLLLSQANYKTIQGI
ncbi:MAG: TolC family protein [Flavobacteriaceae bacterium]|nr:TolC family protein [Flavobacteriaceae bacterium]